MQFNLTHILASLAFYCLFVGCESLDQSPTINDYDDSTVSVLSIIKIYEGIDNNCELRGGHQAGQGFALFGDYALREEMITDARVEL